MSTAKKLFLKTVQRVLDLPRSWKIALASFLLLILLILLFPFQIVVVPGWALRVVDHSNQSVTGINVTEHWQHYLVESAGHEEMRPSDATGRVDFPERTIRAGLLSRGLRTIRKFFKKRQEARTDPYAAIVVWGSREYGTTTAIYPGTGTPQETIVVQRY